MKKILTTLLAGLLIAAVAAPASALEFGLQGTWLWGYDYVSQAGRAGFFGPYDFATPGSVLVNPVFSKVNSLNAWVGARTINGIQYGLVTGADAALQWSRMELNPEIRLNKAVRLRAAYQIGSGTNEYGLYANSAAFGAWNPIASGTWTQWWMTAQTPWGILIGGKRPFAWGMGAQYDGTSCTSESFGVVAPYGPLRIGILIYPWRGQIWINDFQHRTVISSTNIIGVPGWDGFPSTRYRTWDNDAKRQLQPAAFVTYSAANSEAGVVYEWFALHNGPGGAVNPSEAFNFVQTTDAVYEDGSAFFKYNNGRFFFNTELAWFRGQNRYQKVLNGGPPDIIDGGGSRSAPYDLEAWKWMLELGAMSGPAKLSLFYSWVPGPDRRHGIWINRQSWENVVNGSFFGDTQAFLPYSLLMGYQYGAGLNALNRNGEGYMTDAISYGARIDYAVAANLNMYGTFFYANRQSKGWGWASLILIPDGTNGGGRVALLGQQFPVATTSNGLQAFQNDFTNGAPNIPNDYLGWEVTLGADWKLLEGLTVRLRGAYWEVGDWFKFACLDKAIATQNFPIQADGVAIGAGWGINPNRAIDPIWMFQGVMVVDF